ASPTPTEGTGEAAEPLCFVREGRLVRVIRRVPNWPTIETQVQHLLAGPTVAEREAGLTSALAGTMMITSILLAGGRVTVNLGDDVEGSGRSDEILAFGQLVCTLTSRSDIRSVSFTRDGQPLEVPRADGSLARGPLSAADYASLMPPG
ncbi:MAG TPA: GerMN domain-containing protein, partial [Pilimelia sp.]|nr:GerMN domain-containing protein [Pilimelia sp.]